VPTAFRILCNAVRNLQLVRMTPEQYSDVRQVYKYAMARDAFTEISRVCEHLMAAGISPISPEYYAMAVGIVTMYGRPFTNNARIGTISTSLVPTEFEALHAKLMEFRHKAFAHSDFTGQLPGHGKMTEVRLVFDGRTVADFSSRPIFEPVLLPHIKALADLLAQKVKESHDNFLNRVLRVIVPQFTEADVGREFELNVEDEKGPMVVRSSEPIAGKYPVVRPMPKIS
jgi:hypothetical protein